MDDAATGHIVEGKYELVKPLARGGMGTVWVGRHVQLGHPVAIKFLDTTVGDKASMRIRFEREARSAANLKSPYIAQVHDYGVDGESPYLVMELLQGEDLNARLKRVKRLSLAETRHFLEHVTKGLRRAHEAGVVHRDLKPGNLFISTVDDDEIMKILDFGIAKANDAGEATKTGEIVGSPHYMSPEQLRADAGLDYRSDLWSLGIIVYRCVTGKLPFPGEQITAVMMKIISEPVPSIAEFDTTLPPALDAFFQRALARAPAERFQSAREMLDAFSALVGLEGAGPPSTTGSRDLLPLSQSNSGVSRISAVAAPAPRDPDPSSPSGTQVSQAVPPQPNQSRTLVVGVAIAVGIGVVAVAAMLARNPSAPQSAEPTASTSASHVATEAPVVATPSRPVSPPEPTAAAVAPTASSSSAAPTPSAPIAPAVAIPLPRPQGGGFRPAPAPTPQPPTPAPQAPPAPKPPTPNGNTID